jgi:CheY-like chemotaxis protein
MGQPAILIYYNHRDEAEKEMVLKHLASVNNNGIITFWRDDQLPQEEARYAHFENVLSQVRVVVIILTANFLNSESVVHPDLVDQLQRWHRQGGTLFPILARSCAWRTVGWLRSLAVYPRDKGPVWEDGGSRAEGRMAEICAEITGVVTGHPDWDSQNGQAISGRPRKLVKSTSAVEAVRSGPWRILSVDDEPGWQRRLTRILSEVNCQVVTADSYEQAVTLLRSMDFDLVTVDLNLDKSTNYADGLELMTRIRELFGMQLPIIVISGTGGLEEQRRSFKEFYVHDFIQKAQLDFEELQDMVLSAIDATQGMPELAD